MSGTDPYPDITTAAVIKLKMDGSQADFVFDAAIEDAVPDEYQALVLECTRPDRRYRPGAEAVVDRLERIVRY
jgi:hypothetical protein